MIRDLIPWTKLTRFGVPDFVVCRLPIFVNGGEIPVGAGLPAETFASRSRFRQLYEQRRIEPVAAPAGSRQSHRHSTSQPVVASAVSTIAATVDTTVSAVTVALPLDAPPVPVSEESRPKQSTRGYVPSRSRRTARPGARK